MSNWAIQYEGNGYTVLTCEVDDAPSPFETSVQHPEYNDEHWIAVETYNRREDAEVGHDKWVRTMKESPPDQLVEVGESPIPKMLDEYYKGRSWRTMVRVPRN